MELTSNLTSIQTVINQCQRRFGELARIKYEDGNKEALDFLTTKIRHYLINENYISESNEVYADKESELKNIILFLILNTRFDNEAVIAGLDEYAHLVNIMPKLSKFVLMHIVLNLHITEFYSEVAVSMPIQLVSELFESANDNFIDKLPSNTLKHVTIIVRHLIDTVNKLDIHNNRMFDIVQDLNNIIGKLLMNLLVHPSVSMPNASETECAIHIGYTLHALLKMLFQVNQENLGCGRILDALILACSTVTQQVTVGIYLEWSEVKEEVMPFQYLVGTAAYKVIERYTKYKPAAQLLSLLTCMAKKPKTLSEIISEASLETIITHIEYADVNQRRWFSALLNKPFFDEDTSMQCLQKWSKLCTVDDVVRILSQSLNKNDDCKELAINCSRHLSCAEISVVITRFFWSYEPWKQFTFSANVEEPMRLLLNKVDQEDGLNEAVTKDIQLLLLKHPQKIISMLFMQSIKSDVYVSLLEPIYQVLNVAINLNNIPLDILRTNIEQEEFSEESQKNLTSLMKSLLRTECTSLNRLYAHVVKPLCNCFRQQKDFAKVDFLHKILEQLPVAQLSDELKEELAIQLFRNLESYRMKYNEFSVHKMSICTSSINIIQNLRSHFQDLPGIIEFKKANELSKMNSFYLAWTNEASCPSFLNYVFSNFASDNSGQMISKLIKILSRCIESEWLLITEDLAASLGMEKALEALTDSIILICEVTRTKSLENIAVYSALSFYLTNFGICVQAMRARDSSHPFEVVISKTICRLIKMLPAAIKYKEGVGLITLLNDDILKTLSKDNQFVGGLMQLEDSKLSQIIAKKMLN